MGIVSRIRRSTAAVAVVGGGLALLPLPSADAAAGTSSISGSVFDDANRNGVRDADEAPFPGQVVQLYVSGGPFVTGVAADADGQFSFSGLADGSYRVMFKTTDWWAMRPTWVPTTTGSLYFGVDVNVAGANRTDLGLRRIVRSTALGSPISSTVLGNGTNVESYNDVVSAGTIAANLASGSLFGAEAPVSIIRFDFNSGSSCTTSVSGGPGDYHDFSASIWIDYLSWLDTQDRVLFHEYGHAWSLYYEEMVQQEADTFTGYLQARGLTGDSRLNTSKAWVPAEMIAEDYRQLFGSPSARPYALDNASLPPSDSIPGLRDFLRTTFMQAPTNGPSPQAPAPAPAVDIAITGLTVNPNPVSTEGTASFSLNLEATVRLAVVDATGAVVRTLVDGVPKQPGLLSAAWDRKNDAGRKVKSGTYAVIVSAVASDGQQATARHDFAVVDLARRK